MLNDFNMLKPNNQMIKNQLRECSGAACAVGFCTPPLPAGRRCGAGALSKRARLTPRGGVGWHTHRGSEKNAEKNCDCGMGLGLGTPLGLGLGLGVAA